MKILTISDVESPYYWDYFDKKKLEGIDCIISCGDVKPEYLSFLATFAHGPVFYVHGNYDGRYEQRPPEGCICIEDRIETYQGIRILGMGGSMRYREGSSHQYTEKEMRGRLRKVGFQLLMKGGMDILVTHAPAAGLGDGKDLPHQGFQIFRKLIDVYEPKYFLHGHMHLNYGANLERTNTYGNTTIINAYEKYIFEY